jgi:hypothetical protein
MVAPNGRVQTLGPCQRLCIMLNREENSPSMSEIARWLARFRTVRQSLIGTSQNTYE